MKYPNMNEFAKYFVQKLDPSKEMHIDFQVLYNRLQA